MSGTPNKNDAPSTYPPINPNFPPPNCPPPVIANPYVYPYSFIPPPSYFSTPPPSFIPQTSANPAFNYYPPVSIPSPYPVYPNISPNVINTSATEDDFDLNKFFPGAEKKPSIVSQVKLWEVSRKFKSYYRMLKELEAELEHLNDENTEVDESKLRHIFSLKEKLIDCKNSFNQDPLFLICLKFKINKRAKKRLYRKRKRKNKSHIHVHEVASEHMQQLEQQASHIKEEEKVKQDADNILSSVIQKKTDARYQIQLLQNLLKLHSARVHRLTIETNFTPDASVTGFEKVLEKLISLWESKMQEYTTEENGLKMMIKELAVNAEDEDIKKLQNTFDQWLEFIFGTKDLLSGVCYNSYEQLIAIRQGWDKFVVDENDPNGSKIPGGWVIPKYNQNESWNKFLFN